MTRCLPGQIKLCENWWASSEEEGWHRLHGTLNEESHITLRYTDNSIYDVMKENTHTQ